MKKYSIRITRAAKKDIDTLSPKLKKKLKHILLEVIVKDPQNCGKRLAGRLEGKRSYRLTYRDRIVWSINETDGIVYIERARTHYGD